MKHINEAYQFFLTIPGQSQVQVYPEIESMTWIWKFYESQKFYTRELDTDLVFTDNIHSTFAALKALEDDKTTCYKVEIEIKYRNKLGVWVTCYNGYLPYRKGNWSFSRGALEIKPVSDDNLRCFINNWKKKKNLFDITERVEVKTLVGTLECKTVKSNENHTIIPDGYGWTLTKTEYIEEVDSDDTIIKQDYFAKYCREKYIGTPPGSGWVLENGNYYRVITVANPRTITSATVDRDSSDDSITITTTVIKEWSVVDFSTTNGLRIKSVLEYLAQDCSLSIISNFLNINPTSEDIFLQEYDYAAEELDNIVLFQASDLIRPGEGFVRATKFEKSLEQVFDILKKFDLFVFWDSTNSALRIEHESYRSRRLMLDLTQTTNNSFVEALKGNREYEYEENDFPQIELFKDLYEDGGEDFTDASIEYDEYCSTSLEGSKESTTSLEHIICDVAAIYNNEELIEEKKIRTAIVAVALDSNDNILTGIGDISGETILNAPFAWANVLTRYHLRGRPVLRGLVNGEETNFINTKPIRKQSGLQFELTRDDYFENFIPDDKVKTQFGWGEVLDNSYEEPNREMTLDVGFRLET